MKVSLNNVLNTDKDFRSLQMEIFIRAHTLMENHQVMGNIFGSMEATSKESLKMG